MLMYVTFSSVCQTKFYVLFNGTTNEASDCTHLGSDDEFIAPIIYELQTMSSTDTNCCLSGGLIVKEGT